MNLNRLKLISFVGLALIVNSIAGAAAAAAPRSTSFGQAAAEPARITAADLMAKQAKGEDVVIIDVRGKDYDSSDKRIKGAMRIPPADFKAHVDSLPRDREIVTYCACGDDGGAIKTAQTLIEHGFKNVRVLKGGWNGWLQAGGAVELK